MNPSLADLDKDAVPAKVDPLKTDIKEGDGDKQAADLEAERQRQLAEADKGKTSDKPIVDRQPGEKKGADKPAPADDGKGDDDLEPEGTIWDDVDKLRGEKLDVEWGDIPEDQRDTPQAILVRDRTIESRAVTRFEESLMQTDPRGYQYLLHRQAGGTDEDFFAQKTIDLPAYETFKESVDLQTKVYTQALRNTGIPEKQVKMLVDAAVKDKEIFELADAAYKAKVAGDEKSIRELNQQLERDQQQYSRMVEGLDKAITEQMSSKDMSIVVPEAQREAFTQYVRQRVQYDEANRRFLFAQPIDPKQLPRQLEALYLQFKNGNLGELVRREAQTDNTRRLKRRVDASKETSKDQGSDGGKRKMTLGDL